MFGRRLLVPAFAIGVLASVFCLAGCINVKAPEEINIGGHSKPKKFRPDRLPETHGEEDCREKLGDAYDRIDSLEREIKELEEDKEILEKQRDSFRDRYRSMKEKYH